MSVALRPWADRDLSLLVRLMGDPAMTEHLGGPEPLERIEARHRRYCAMDDTGNGRMFVIVAGPAAESVGSVGYWERERRGELVWETGWSVLPEFQGRGLATRAVAAVLELARAEQKHRFVHAFPSVSNPASNAICRKSGFTLLGDEESEYPPGSIMRCNDWRFDLFGDVDRAGGR